MTALFADRLADVRHPRLRDAPRHHRDRHDRRRQGQVRPPDRRRTDAHPPLGPAGGCGARPSLAIAEDRLPFSTGEVINVDGGFHLRIL